MKAVIGRSVMRRPLATLSAQPSMVTGPSFLELALGAAPVVELTAHLD